MLLSFFSFFFDFYVADILRGRTWREVKSAFIEIWTLAFRVVDDVKVNAILHEFIGIL